MTLGITATFPLGVYQGHRSDGTAEPLPDPARLHAAFLCAAAQGPRAVVVDGRMEPCAEDIEALIWLESNPPTGIRVPDHRPVSPRTLTAYRREGVIVKEAGRIVDKVTSRDHSDGSAINGSVGWYWQDVPPRVQDSLSALSGDVACLGEATSPVVLRVEAVEPNLLHDPSASLFDLVGDDVRIAGKDRTTALRQAHRAAHPTPPTVTQDRHSITSDMPNPAPVASEGLHMARYRPVDPPAAIAPWSQALLIPTDTNIAVRERIQWCVAVHRALLSRIGTGASAMVTGVYGPGAERPANRLAIHYLAANVVKAHGHGDQAAFALFLPHGSSAEDRAQLASAIKGWTRVSRSRQDLRVSDEQLRVVDAGSFWAPVAESLVRMWLTHPAAVPETRPISTAGGRRWTLADAAAVSVGMVWRDELGAKELRGPDQYRHLRAAVADRGVRILDVTALKSEHVRSFVHTTPAGLVVQPYRARLTLGALAGDRTAIAIGQSRHLGGGLLVPCDVPGDLLLNSIEER